MNSSVVDNLSSIDKNANIEFNFDTIFEFSYLGKLYDLRESKIKLNNSPKFIKNNDLGFKKSILDSIDIIYSSITKIKENINELFK